MKIVMVGEAWGRSEEQFRHPLVGASGRELTLQIGQSGLGPYLTKTCRKCKQVSRFVDARCENCHEHLWPDEFDLITYWRNLRESNEIHVTNVFNCRPPNNELGTFFGTEKETEMPAWKASKTYGGSHLLAEHFHHIKRLWDELSSLKPNLVVAMGNAACWAILGQTKITSLRGTVNWSDRLGLKVLPVFHPAAILRQWSMRPTSIADLRKAASEREFPEIRRPERWITIPHPSPRGIDEIRAWLSDPATRILANDIETVRGQISIIGFARSPSISLVVPFRDCHSQGGQLVDIGRIGRSTGNDNAGINFWPTADLEQSAWKLCIDTIQSKRVELIFQNGIYDMSYYLRMGILPYRAIHDTMLWHHSEYLELPKALGFLGSLYSNEISWKLMSKSQDSLKRDE
jgi:uracil-DNA glycosylase